MCYGLSDPNIIDDIKLKIVSSFIILFVKK